jgi:uncharacterized membrane protein YfcA
LTEWLLIPLGFAVGAYGTLIGAGGGFVLVPVLLLLYPTAAPSTVTSISLAVVFLNAVSGSIAYARERRIDYRSAAAFATATIPGAVLGALVVNAIPRPLFNALFGLILLLLAVLMFMRPAPKHAGARSLKSGMQTRVIIDASGIRHEYQFYQWQGIVLSIGVGFLSSLLGIGGGIIHVPAMVLMLDFPTHIATATSQLILAVAAGVGTSVHLLTGELAIGSGLRRALLLSVGVIPGAFVGVQLSRRMQGPWIIRLLAVSLVLIGLRLLVSAAGS